MSFNEKLQKLRKANKLSQEQLADMLDVTRQSVSKWESGYTYPEMDKLISMCKIFKCSLDDLTNDEITDITIETKKKNNFNSFVDSFLNFIRQTYQMFKKMNFKEKLKCLIIMFIVGLTLMLLQLPFDEIKDTLFTIISSVNNDNLTMFLSGSINLLIDLCYWLLYILIFTYIFKIAYLDNFNPKENINSDVDVKEITNEVLTEINNPVFYGIGKVVMFIIKMFVCFFAIPFVISLFVLSISFLITIVLLFKGVFYLSILFGIIFALLLNILIIEVIINFLFNYHNNVKRLIITFIISIIGLGISVGILMFEIANTTYINEAPDEKITTINEIVPMNDSLIIDLHYYDGTYIVDNEAGDDIKIEVSYYQDYLNAMIDNVNNRIIITSSDMDKIVVKKLFNTIVEGLDHKQIYNYSKLGELKITIYGSESNIVKLKNNIENYNQQLVEQENQAEIDELYHEIDLLENKIDTLENENIDLQTEVDNYKNQITNYQDNLKALLDEN